MDHLTINFNNMPMAAIVLDIKKPLIQHGTFACYINYLHHNFLSV
jgi:hypothetical protein